METEPTKTYKFAEAKPVGSSELTQADIAAITTTATRETIVPIARKLDAAMGMDLLDDWAAGKDMKEWRDMLAKIISTEAA